MVKAFTRYSLKDYKGVFFILGTSPVTGEPERIYYIRYRTPDGKMVEEKVGRPGKPDKMTPAKARAIREDRLRGLDLPNRMKREAERAEKAVEATRWTFDKLWTAYKESNDGKRGLVNDENRFKNHLLIPFGDMEPKYVLPLEMDRLRLSMLKGIARPPGRKRKKADKGTKKPYAVGTVISVLSLFKRIANFGVKRRLCEGLRFAVEMPKGAREKTEDMTEQQMARYIRICREWPDRQAGDFQLLLLFTGARRGEIRNLKWSDVDLDRGFLALRGRKGGEDVTIPMSDAARAVIEAQPRTKNVFVFPGERGEGPRGIRQIGDTARAIRDAAGLPKDWRPSHGLRHTFASHLASSGEVDLYTVQRLLGHKSPVMTQRYSHLRDEALRRGTDVMGRIAKEAEGTAGGET
jgi:integrase